MHVPLDTLFCFQLIHELILHFKNQPCIRLYLKEPTGMHWLGYNDAVPWLNEAKTRIFQPIANFENFEIYLYFICLPACQPASLS